VPKAQIDEYQYGGAAFEACSTALHRLRRGVRNGALGRPAAREVIRLARLPQLLLRLPKMTVSLTRSPAGSAIEEHLETRRWGIPKNRIAQAILPIPSDVEEYRRGRSRRALRTNVRKAQSMGLVVRRLDTASEREGAVAHFFRSGSAQMVGWESPAAWVTEMTRADDVWWAVVDGSGDPAALAALTIDVQWAMLIALVSLNAPARWLVHSYVTETLVEADVSYLCLNAPNALLEEPGNQYFQQLLGYRVAHLSLDNGDG